ncbi:uncharacterized protein [Drosophila kikkawai]|uniref:Uncharacterized protein n=1 Tax=Drosophila kikkawai TaxID=30033 RepID=A0A6P4IN90_DROKI|nr:uncharacterized protein LOC108076549 [Drosophila kikkawai]
MSSNSLLSITGGLFLIILIAEHCSAKRKWDYEPLSINTYSSDESKLKFVAKIERVARGEFAIGGTIDFKYTPDSNTMVEAVAHRSISGAESDYKLIPFTIAKQPFPDYMNSHYKDLVIRNLAKCSNLIQFEGKFDGVWPQKVYTLDKCVADSDGFPEMVPEGFYRINFTVTNPVDWGFVLIVKIFNKLM